MDEKGDFFMAEYVQREEKTAYVNGIVPILKSLLVGFLFSLAALFILSVIMWLTNVKEVWMRPAVLIVTLLAMVICGRKAALLTSLRGFMIGGISGLLYMLIIYFIAVLAFSAVPFNINVLVRFVYAFVAGAIGGIFGKNFVHKKKIMHAKKA